MPGAIVAGAARQAATWAWFWQVTEQKLALAGPGDVLNVGM